MRLFRYLGVACLFVVGAFLTPANLQAESSEKIKIGAILPLSGGLAEYGEAARNGIELAKAQNPKAFENINFIYEDNQYEGKKAISAFNKLVSTDKVDILFVWGFGPNQAVAPLAEARKIPTLGVTGEKTLAKDKKYVTRFCYYGEQAADALLDYFRKNEIKRVGILKTEMAFTNDIFNGLTANKNKDETVELVDNFQFGDHDFKPSISRLKNDNYDALGIFLSSGQISQFYKQAAAVKYQPKTFGTDFFESKTEIVDAKGNMEGAVFPAPYVTEDFKKAYLDKYGNDLQISWAANAYDFAALTADLFADGLPSSDKIIQSYKGVAEAKGASGTYGYADQVGGFRFKMAMKKIEDGNIHNIQ